MNKIICPHCKNVNILNNNIKICVFKCPCCGKEVTMNNCCNGKCTIPNEVYAVVGQFIFAGGIKETRTIKLFKDRKKADKYIEDFDPFEVLESFRYFERTTNDFIESFYSVVAMEIE